MLDDYTMCGFRMEGGGTPPIMYPAMMLAVSLLGLSKLRNEPV